MITRRHAIQKGILAATAVGFSAPLLQAQTLTNNATSAAPATATGPFVLPPLPYDFEALEPFIDAQTMQIHHGKHHQAYVTNLNKALADKPDLAKKSVEELIRDISSLPEGIRTAMRNYGGGHANHTLFWEILSKKGGDQPKGELAKAIDKKFNSYSSFKEGFTKAATSLFGSGWTWLTVGANKELFIESTANQDSPLMGGLAAGQGAMGSKNSHSVRVPLLGIDMWEHAYYLKYQNKRPDYIAAFYNIINWDKVSERFQKLSV